ncbi:hypothetical protein [Enterococcus mundtii]|uniref:hypothetical protein n=1 Tax=Enterococcus mundtii TaxID=53346 RepID=UPI0035C6FBB0
MPAVYPDCLYSLPVKQIAERTEVLLNQIIRRYQERVQQPKIKLDFEEIVHACIDRAGV